MNARPTDDPCPECGTPFDTRPDAPGSYTRSTTILVCLWLAIAAAPFAALLSIALWFIASVNDRGLRKSLPGHRLPYRVKRRMHLAKWLWWIGIAWWFGLMFVSKIWPNALNWW